MSYIHTDDSSQYENPVKAVATFFLALLVVGGGLYLLLGLYDQEPAPMPEKEFNHYPSSNFVSGPVRKIGEGFVWTYTTKDSPARVRNYHYQEDKLGAWSTKRDSEEALALVLSRGDHKVVITTTTASGTTTIRYTLKLP